MVQRLQDFPPLRKSLIREAQVALLPVGTACQGRLEKQWYELLRKTLEGLLESSLAGYLGKSDSFQP